MGKKNIVLILFFLSLASSHRQTGPQLLLLFCGITLLNHHLTCIFTPLNSHTSCLPETISWRTNTGVQIPYHAIQRALSFGPKFPFFHLQLYQLPWKSTCIFSNIPWNISFLLFLLFILELLLRIVLISWPLGDLQSTKQMSLLWKPLCEANKFKHFSFWTYMYSPWSWTKGRELGLGGGGQGGGD